MVATLTLYILPENEFSPLRLYSYPVCPFYVTLGYHLTYLLSSDLLIWCTRCVQGNWAQGSPFVPDILGLGRTGTGRVLYVVLI